MRVPKVKLVYDRRHQSSPDKEGAVDLRVCFNCKQKFLSTGVKVYPKQWDSKNECVKLRNDATSLNKALSDIKNDAISLLTEMSKWGYVDLARLNEIFKTKAYNLTFIDYIKQRIPNRNVTAQTRERYESWLTIFADEFGLIRTFSDITEANIRTYDEWLHKRMVNGHLMSQSTIYSHHKYLRLFIYDALTDEYVDRNPYTSRRIKIDHGEGGQIPSLTMEQVEQIESLDLGGFLGKTKDLFLFQCYTGLAFSDMLKFRLSNYSQDKDGNYLIKDKRTKTDTTYIFLLSEKALAIVMKYKGKIPTISNQKYNQYLKLLGQMIGVPTLHSHMGRSTFASTCLNQGMATDVLKYALGHRTTLQTNRYATMQDETIKKAFEDISK